MAQVSHDVFAARVGWCAEGGPADMDRRAADWRAGWGEHTPVERAVSLRECGGSAADESR